MSDRDYAKLTVNVLKEELKRRKLEQTGKKADLVSRLEAHDAMLKIDQASSIPAEKSSSGDSFAEGQCDEKDVPTKEIASSKDGSKEHHEELRAGSAQDEKAEDLSSGFETSHVETQRDVTMGIEASQVETRVTEVPRVVAPMVEVPQDETEAAEDAKVEAAKVEDAKVEAAKVEDVKVVSAPVEDVKIDAPESEVPPVETAQVEVSRIDVSQPEDMEAHHVERENDDGRASTVDAKGTSERMPEKGPLENTEENEVTLGAIENESEAISTATSGGIVDSSDSTVATKTETLKVGSAEDDLRISNLFGIEMRRERDAFQLKWHGQRFNVPFIGDIVIDLAAEVSQRSFAVKLITVEDIQTPYFQEVIFNAAKFLLNFQENVLEPSQSGFAKFVFKNNEDCLKFKDSLKLNKGNLVIENISFDDQLAQQFLNRDVIYYKGTIVDRLLYVGNLSCNVAECTVRDLFPDALRVIFPPLKDLDEGINSVRRYVYVEYQTSEDVIAASEKCRELKLNGEKLFVIKALCMKKERFGLLTDKLRSILLEKVRKMRKIQKNPWNKSRQELQEIDKTISMNMDKLITDSKHRKNWGMELGALDESRLDQVETEKIDSIPERGQGQRGGAYRPGPSRPYESRRGHSSSRTWGGLYGSSGYVNSGYAQSGGAGGYGQQDPYFNKRKSSDLGGDWKRGRYY